MQNIAFFILAALDVLVGIVALAIGDKNSKLKVLLVILFFIFLIVIIVVFFISPTPTPVQETVTPSLIPSPSSTPKPISIAGKWIGVTTGTNAGNPMSERATTVSIQSDCQLDDTCGFFKTEGGCVYELTLREIQGDDYYIFETLTISGEDFCNVDAKNRAELKLISDSKLYFHYESPGAVVVREGNLTKQ